MKNKTLGGILMNFWKNERAGRIPFRWKAGKEHGTRGERATESEGRILGNHESATRPRLCHGHGKAAYLPLTSIESSNQVHFSESGWDRCSLRAEIVGVVRETCGDEIVIELYFWVPIREGSSERTGLRIDDLLSKNGKAGMHLSLGGDAP